MARLLEVIMTLAMKYCSVHAEGDIHPIDSEASKFASFTFFFPFTLTASKLIYGDGGSMKFKWRQSLVLGS